MLEAVELDEARHPVLFRNARRVGEEVTNRDRRPLGWQRVEISRDRILEPDPTLLDQLHDAGGGELLRDRSEPEQRLRGYWRSELDVGEPIARGLHDGAAPGHGDGDPGNSGSEAIS